MYNELCFGPPLHESLVFGFSIFLLSPSISHPHTFFSYNVFHSEKEKTGRAGVSRVGAKMPEREPEVFGTSFKTNCDKVSVCNESVEIGPGMLDYLMCSAPTYRERILTSEKKSKTGVNTFFLLFLSFVGFHGVFGILPPLLWCWIVAFWSFFGGIVVRMEDYVVRWNDLQVNSFCCLVLSLLFFPMVFAAEWRPVIFFLVQADTTIVVVFSIKD